MPRKAATTEEEATGCAHCGGELVEYGEANPAKVGRLLCADCNCSWADGALVTRGATCKA